MKITWQHILVALVFNCLVVVSFCLPTVLSDKNKILATFINEQMIATLGVVISVNIAALAQFHLSLNKIQASLGNTFKKVRDEIKSSGRWMVTLFAISTLLLFIKSIIGDDFILQSLLNSLQIVLLLVFILIMYDIIDTIFEV